MSKERDERKNNEFVSNFFFINRRKTHTNECEKSLQYIKN